VGSNTWGLGETGGAHARLVSRTIGPTKARRIQNRRDPIHGLRRVDRTNNPHTFTAQTAESLTKLPPGSLARIGAQADTVTHARLITPLDSAFSKPGEKIEAVLAEPVYSADRQLILPEGTRLEGAVATVRPARWFRRSGQLRFNFQEIVLPEEVVRLQENMPQAPLAAAQRPT
jgi:hypothetical protein